MAKIIFLDFDGVLNNPFYLSGKSNRPRNSFGLDSQRLTILKRIVASTGARIVATSSWRFTSGLDEFFEENGLELYDRVPDLLIEGHSKEIEEWLKDHPEVKNYLILDDESSEYTEEQMAHAIITRECYTIPLDKDYSEGLQEKHIAWAIEMLKGEM